MREPLVRFCINALAHVHLHSTNKEGVGRDGSPEGFDSNGGQLNSQMTFRLTKRVLEEMVLPKVSTAFQVH